MGIKGLYGELGSGHRIAISKLSMEHFKQTGRPLRVAIDAPIWQYQIRAGKGGPNPELRTLYYRLLRLLASNIDPLFVFDGPQKPEYKGNKETKPHIESSLDKQVKQLLKLFGFSQITAPGEAEAECALLQREGLVDLVLSEDVDVLMFGCTRSIRNWGDKDGRGNGTPTYVDFYDTERLRTSVGIDSEGMVLIALMSGGDYSPAGIPGCGIKTACEAARAGFGHDLCSLSQNDISGIRQWRERLTHELQTNESGLFNTRHKSLKIPDTFPDTATIGYYTHPVVSNAEELSTLRQKLKWTEEVDTILLSKFVTEHFQWDKLSIPNKFVRRLAPALLSHRLRVRGENGGTNAADNSNTAIDEENKLIQSICARRTHHSTDSMPEL